MNSQYRSSEGNKEERKVEQREVLEKRGREDKASLARERKRRVGRIERVSKERGWGE